MEENMNFETEGLNVIEAMPETGNAGGILAAVIGIAALSGLAWFGFKKYKEAKNPDITKADEKAIARLEQKGCVVHRPDVVEDPVILEETEEN